VTQMFKANDDLKDLIACLKNKRDDMAHDRGPGESELGRALATTEAELESLFASADFLSQYPLRDISYALRVGRQQRGSYSCRDLVGDHPVTVRRTVEFEGETPAKGLHFIDQSGRAHFIEPWLVRRRCTKCQHEETYVLDRYMNSGAIMYKSMEYGHEMDLSELRSELLHVGIDLPIV
jgi:hypothetical protein